MTSILYRAVFNADILQCNLSVHSVEWGLTIFGGNNTHICVFWGVRSHLLCVPKHTANLPVSRVPDPPASSQPHGWGLILPGGKRTMHLR